MRRLVAAVCCCALSAGCVMVEVGVTNPVQGLTTVAVAPFFNLSHEQAADGRRFALAYYTELQKVPGFEVVPVGVVEQAIFDNGLEMQQREDVLELVEILGVDAVVVGAVTDYDPYYPPRIGLQASWYSTQPWSFYPGIPTDPHARKRTSQPLFPLLRKNEECPDCQVVRGQSDDRPELPPPVPGAEVPGPLPGSRNLLNQTDRAAAIANSPPPHDAAHFGPAAPPFDPREPLMSYTRLFDGSDAKLVARLRDYLELSGDVRSGGWEGYLHRSEDFIRFTAHLMVVEMLQLHGGEASRRYVVKLRKYR